MVTFSNFETYTNVHIAQKNSRSSGEHNAGEDKGVTDWGVRTA